ncbi:MAG TPA: dihydropteroate synthase, partial [Anaerolineae bacterium]|nr:dihydropteroate synthase [Anaerolineae bacterium]
MDTVLRSPSQTVVIGPNRPFVIIGERINPTGRKMLAAEMAAGDFSRVIADAKAQVEAGAHVLDINSGVPLADEAEIMAEAVRLVQATVDVPLCIDSSVVKALEAGLKAAAGKPLVNSVTGEEERLEAVLPLVAERGAAVIAISNDETGISYDPRERFKVAKKIVQRAESYGIPRADVLIDPLAMPVGAIHGAGKHLFDIVRMVREELGCNTICGASNISFGLPNRRALNATFVAMSIAAGMPCTITNPLEPEIMAAIRAADVMMGHDENCAAWIMSQRQAAAATQPEAAAAPVDDRAARRAAREA